MPDQQSTFHETQSPIALLIPDFEAGGAERVMIRLARGLVNLGHDVDLVVLADHGPYRAEVDPRVNVISLQAQRAWQGIYPLIRYLRHRRPKALLSAIFHANFAAAVAGALSGTGTRIVLSEHNTLDLVKSSVSTLRWIIFQIALRLTYPLAHAVVCVSSGVSRGLAAALPQLEPKLVVIPNPVVTDELLKQSHMTVNHPWLEAHQPPLILAVGRLIPAKGFDILIQAFAQVLTKRSARLLILGEGAERQALQALINDLGLQDHAWLYGFEGNPYAWMRRADLFVLSSRHEGLPGALIEAMACGCKVVATNCPHGPDEILEYGKWGSLTPVGDVSALAQAMDLELGSDRGFNPELRAQHYHLEKVIQQYIKALKI